MALKFFKSLLTKFTGKAIDWDELEETLLRAELGIPLTQSILEDLQSRGKEVSSRDILEVTRSAILNILPLQSYPLRPFPNKPKVILLIGVNGTGKTTSAAKLAYALKKKRHTVQLVAADTFRAAAIEQLTVWGERIGVEVIRSQYKADSAALCYDAYTAAAKNQVEFLICDTAGRLHTRHNLMQELSKLTRILAKQDTEAPHEKLLVVDATTGSNALEQAKQFHQITPLTGIIVTKLDGSGKGGMLVAIQNELGIPPRYLGLGEHLEDFQSFDRNDFVEQIL